MSYMTDVKGAALGSLREFIKCGLLTIASQPKNNAVDLDNPSLLRLYVLLIDHDYPGGSAAMHNAVFDAYGLPYRGFQIFCNDIVLYSSFLQAILKNISLIHALLHFYQR